jgi:phage terminase large subunit-like protein
LLDFQKQLIRDLFTLTADGLRRYRQALVMMPRKNGKTFLLACLALYDAVTGEPGGEVYFVAGDRQQARRAFDECRRIVEMDPELSDLFEVYRNHMEIPSTGTVLRVLSADAGLQQGLNPSFVVFDEVAVQPNADLWHAMTLGSGTRTQALVVGISTPGHSRDSLLWRLYEYGKRVQAGEVADESFFFRAWEPEDPDCDHTDPAVWSAVNPALGRFLNLADFHSTVLKTPENDFRRFRLGQWVSSQSAALPHGAWEGCADPGRTPDGPVVLTLDPTFGRECVALLGCTTDSEPHVFVVDIYEAQEAGERRTTAEIVASVEDALHQYDVAALCADRNRCRPEVADLEAAGYEVVDVPSRPERLRAAWQALYSAILEHRVTHDANPTLARHLGNLQVKEDRVGMLPVRGGASPGAFSEGAFAAMVAFGHAQTIEPPALPGIEVLDFAEGDEDEDWSPVLG